MASNETNVMMVEVAYALPQRQEILAFEVPFGTTVQQAARQSGIVRHFPEIDLATAKMGIFGKAAKGDAVLQPGDRVEIYRALIADPKAVRKQRAAEGKKMKKGGGDAEEGAAGEADVSS
jgi:putative ubiquitin-RnfH superfamily antitoxin RatB of RatAB toxin-antitoxin module